MLLLLRQSAPVIAPRTYPLAGVAQFYALAGQAQAFPGPGPQPYPVTAGPDFPLAGMPQTYPLQ